MTGSHDKGLDYLKGLAAFTVLSGHTLDNYVFQSENCGKRIIDVLNLPIIWNLFSAGGVAVCIFCLISGWYAVKSFEDKWQIVIQIIYRYLDFWSLCLVCNIVMLIVQKAGLFEYNMQFSKVIQRSTALSTFSDLTFTNAVISAFKLQSTNGALWMLLYLFFGNVFMYLLSYLVARFNYSWCGKAFLIWSIILLVAVYKYCNVIVFFTIFGGISNLYSRYFKGERVRNRLKNMSAIVLVLALVLAQRTLDFRNRYLWQTLSCELIAISFSILFKKRRNQFLEFLSANSLSFYAVHIPIIYSVGTLVFLRYNVIFTSGDMARIVTYMVIVLMIMVIGYGYNIIVETPRRKLARLIRKKMIIGMKKIQEER